MPVKRLILLVPLALLIVLAAHSCYDPNIPNKGFICEKNGRCPRGFFCDTLEYPPLCKREGTPHLNLGTWDFPDMDPMDEAGGDLPGLDSKKPDSMKPDSVIPDSTKPDSVIPDSTKPDSTKPDSGLPANCKETVLVTGVQKTAGSFDLAADSTGIMHIYYIKDSTGAVEELYQSGGGWTTSKLNATATKLSATIDTQDTGHLAMVSSNTAYHATRGKSSSWDPRVAISVEGKPGTYHPALVPGDVHMDGTSPPAGVVDGTVTGTSTVGPFDVLLKTGGGMKFNFPCQFQKTGTTYSGCRIAASTNKRYMVCATKDATAGSGWWVTSDGAPPSCNSFTQTSISTPNMATAPALRMDSSNAMHMAYLQQLTSSALGGYPNYGHWSGSGKVTLRTGPIYNSERIKAGSIDIVRNKSAYVYITAQTVTSKKLILLTGAMASGAFKATTISSYGGAESRIHSGTKYLHFVHVDTSGNLRYSCMLPPSP